jgi:hypothetical protein
MGILIFLTSFILSTQTFAIPTTVPNYQFDFSTDVAGEYNGTASSGCTGAIIKLIGQPDTAKALYITNAHCVSMIPYTQFRHNVTTNTNVQIRGLNNNLTLTSRRLIYSSLTVSDIAIFELPKTYAELHQEIGLVPFILANQMLTEGTNITLKHVSSNPQNCSIEKITYRLKEGTYIWKESFRYSTGCNTVPGWSGTAVISQDTGMFVGIHNTGGDGSSSCAMNSPCEIDENGQTTYLRGRDYGQQTYMIYNCFNSNYEFDLNLATCDLAGGPAYRPLQ